MGESEVDRITAPVREIGEVADVDLDANLGFLGALSGSRDRLVRRVDCQHRGARSRQFHRARSVAAPEFQDAFACDLAEQFP